MRLKQTKTKTKESQMQNGAQILSFKNNNPIAELKSIREQLKAFQEREGDLKAQINNLLDQAGVEELVIGNDKVKRTLTERSTFDSKIFESVHPDLYAEFKKSTCVITLKTI